MDGTQRSLGMVVLGVLGGLEVLEVLGDPVPGAVGRRLLQA